MYPVFKVTNQIKTILQLDNTGLLRSRAVKVDRQTWADYVFEENYNLRTLKEVENFIIQNGHLPEIQSREEIIENGLDLGDMLEKMMMKIEELTLYQIEQQKLLEQQQKLINEQKEIIESLIH